MLLITAYDAGDDFTRYVDAIIKNTLIIVMNHAKRVVDIPYISKEELSLIKEEDLGL